MKRISKIVASIALIAGVVLIPANVIGQADSSDVTQEINGGTLTAAILDASRNPVALPTFAMTATNFSFTCGTATGTLGTTDQRLYVINPSGTAGATAWALSLAATGPWADGGTTYAYNDPAGSGCDNGQLTVNATPGSLVNDCISTACTTATINKGSSTAMSGATPVTILSAPSGASVYRGYITGVTLSQAIPPEQPAGSYTLPVTLTAAAS